MDLLPNEKINEFFRDYRARPSEENAKRIYHFLNPHIDKELSFNKFPKEDIDDARSYIFMLIFQAIGGQIKGIDFSGEDVSKEIKRFLQRIVKSKKQELEKRRFFEEPLHETDLDRIRDEMAKEPPDEFVEEEWKRQFGSEDEKRAVASDIANSMKRIMGFLSKADAVAHYMRQLNPEHPLFDILAIIGPRKFRYLAALLIKMNKDIEFNIPSWRKIQSDFMVEMTIYQLGRRKEEAERRRRERQNRLKRTFPKEPDEISWAEIGLEAKRRLISSLSLESYPEKIRSKPPDEMNSEDVDIIIKKEFPHLRINSVNTVRDIYSKMKKLRREEIGFDDMVPIKTKHDEIYERILNRRMRYEILQERLKNLP